jgi:hypothetical protein
VVALARFLATGAGNPGVPFQVQVPLAASKTGAFHHFNSNGNIPRTEYLTLKIIYKMQDMLSGMFFFTWSGLDLLPSDH